MPAERAGVILILNGARSKKALRHEWDKQPAFAPILRAWFPHEVRKVRRAINHTLQTWGERPLPHPRHKQIDKRHRPVVK